MLLFYVLDFDGRIHGVTFKLRRAMDTYMGGLYLKKKSSLLTSPALSTSRSISGTPFSSWSTSKAPSPGLGGCLPRGDISESEGGTSMLLPKKFSKLYSLWFRLQLTIFNLYRSVLDLPEFTVLRMYVQVLVLRT